MAKTLFIFGLPRTGKTLLAEAISNEFDKNGIVNAVLDPPNSESIRVPKQYLEWTILIARSFNSKGHSLIVVLPTLTKYTYQEIEKSELDYELIHCDAPFKTLLARDINNFYVNILEGKDGKHAELPGITCRLDIPEEVSVGFNSFTTSIKDGVQSVMTLL